MKKQRFSAKEVAVIGACAALMVISQVALSGIPNVELVSLFLILFTRAFKRDAFIALYLYVIAEGLIYGIGMWWFSYLYCWLPLYFTARFLKEDGALLWAIVSGLFGLLFGTICSIPSFIMFGFSGGVSWIVSGLSFDLTHAAGNFAVALMLYKPLSLLLECVTRSGIVTYEE